MSEKLNAKRKEYIEKLKRLKLAEAGVAYDDLDTYVKYLNADSKEEIEKQAQAIVSDIKQHHPALDSYRNNHIWKPF